MEHFNYANVKVKKLSKKAIIPKYEHAGDAGFDLRTIKDIKIKPGQTIKIPTGLAFEIPEGNMMEIRPRSGLSAKTKFRVITGTIDSGFRGEVQIIAENVTDSGKLTTLFRKVFKGTDGSIFFSAGSRVAQGVIEPYYSALFLEETELSKSDRGADGFGKSGLE